eukprot:277333-Prorocentrum_lima.AAC.1
MSLPTTHLYEGGGEKNFGIARYPIDEWRAIGEPVITVKRWVKLCLKIAQGDMRNLKKVFEVCADMEARL